MKTTKSFLLIVIKCPVVLTLKYFIIKSNEIEKIE